ncbi:hypothetical protein [Ottowia sp. VDI28]|uniref:hypothetical protein n=1 Tax=Ottowia sp. VDI28 TaxID=3133968 RepID=UPI003C2EB6FB
MSQVRWSPALLGADLWLADDVLPDGSGLAAEWRNTLGGAVFYQNTTTARATPQTIPAGGSALAFDGGDYYLTTGYADLYRNKTFGWVLAVAKKTTIDSAAASRVVFSSYNGSGVAVFGLYWDDATSGAQNRIVLGGRRLDADAWNRVASAQITDGGWHIIAGALDWANRTIVLRVDGQVVGSATNAWTGGGATSFASGATPVVGGGTATPARLIGGIAHLIAGSTTLTTADFEKAEGWLAKACGLSGNLPSGHPYKSAALPEVGGLLEARPVRLIDEFSGLGTVTGKTSIKGDPENIPTRAHVSLLRARDNALARQVWSDPLTGAFSVSNLDTARQQFIALARYPDGSMRPVAGISALEGA